MPTNSFYETPCTNIVFPCICWSSKVNSMSLRGGNTAFEVLYYATWFATFCWIHYQSDCWLFCLWQIFEVVAQIFRKTSLYFSSVKHRWTALHFSFFLPFHSPSVTYSYLDSLDTYRGFFLIEMLNFNCIFIIAKSVFFHIWWITDNKK